MNTLNGYSKSTLTDSYLLSAGGGHVPLGNASGNVPLSNGTVNVNLKAEYAQNTGLLDGLQPSDVVYRASIVREAFIDHIFHSVQNVNNTITVELAEDYPIITTINGTTTIDDSDITWTQVAESNITSYLNVFDHNKTTYAPSDWKGLRYTIPISSYSGLSLLYISHAYVGASRDYAIVVDYIYSDGTIANQYKKLVRYAYDESIMIKLESGFGTGVKLRIAILKKDANQTNMSISQICGYSPRGGSQGAACNYGINYHGKHILRPYINNVWSLGTSSYKFKNIYVTTLYGNLNGSYINALTGYSKASSGSSIVATDTLNTALGKLEYKADYAYSWVTSVTATDTDEYINKWGEIVGFLDSVKEGTDILDEFVTRKTAQTITGLKTFQTDSTFFTNGTHGVRLLGHSDTGWLQLGQIYGTNRTHYGAISGIGGPDLAGLLIRSASSTFSGDVTAVKFTTKDGTSSQFVKGDGSLDSNTYATTTQLGNYIPLAPTKFSQYKAGNWTKILTFTIPVNSFTPSISFTWHPTECARYAWGDFNINIRSGAIIFMANWKGNEIRTLKCVGDGTTYNVWVYGIKEGYDPYGSIQVTSTYNIISYQAGSLAYQDADPTGTYTADATKYGAVSSADKLSTVSKTAWGQTYWTSGGVPTSISGNISSTGNITPSATHTYTLGSSSLVYERVYCRYIDTDSGYNLRLCAQGSEKISINAANGCVGINNTSPTHQLTVSGTGYFTRQVRIDGGAASQPLVVRGIVGQNGSGTVGELYLQYGANSGIFLGNTGAHTISADGSKYSGNAATSSRLSEYYELNRSKDSEIIAPKDMPLGMFIRFKNNTGATHNSGWNTVVAMNAFTGGSNTGAGYRHEFLFSDSLNHSDGTFYVRNGVDDTWNPWRKVLTDYNWTSTIDLSTYATKTYVDAAIANAQLGGSSPDLELYFRPTYVNGAGFSFASNTSGNAFAIYAPTSAGASDQILISTGSTPSWTNQSNLSVGNSTRLNGQAASYYATASALDNYFKKTGGTITGTLAVSNTATFYNAVRITNSFNPYMSFVSSSTSEMVSSIYGVTDYNTTSKVYPYGARIFFRLYSVSAANTANATISTSGYEDYVLGPCDAGLTSRVAYNIYTEKNKQSVVSLIGTTDNSDLPLVFTNGVNTSTTSEIFKQLYVNTNKLLLAFNPNSKTLKIHGGNTSGILQLGSNSASVSLSCSGQGILNTPKGFRAVSSDTTPGSLTLGSASGSTTLQYNIDTNDSGVVVKLPAKEGVLATLDMIKWAVYYVSTGSSSYTKQAGNHNFISSATQAGVNTGCAFNISYPNGFSYTNTIISASFGNPADNTDFTGKTISMWSPVPGVLGIYVGGYDTNGVYYSSLSGYSVKLQFMCFNNI